MSDERDPETSSFDADDWFRTQFGGKKPAGEPDAPQVDGAPAEPPAEGAPGEPPAEPPLESPVEPPTLVEPALAPSEIELEATQPSEVIDSTGAPAADAVTELMREPEEGGALDELFGSDSFQEYQETLIPAASGVGAPPRTPPTRTPPTRTQKILLWVAGSLVALLALIAIFFLGTRIPLLIGPAPGAEPSPTPTATPTPTPTATERPVGPVEPGEYQWDELWGGECLEPFVDAWQEQYTVVDCAEPHGGQLVLRAPFALAEGATEQGPYPGEAALAAQMSLLCSGPGALDLALAAALSDLQVQGAYAVTAENWNAGEQDYFCFVSRSSAEPLTGSLAVPPAAPAG